VDPGGGSVETVEAGLLGELQLVEELLIEPGALLGSNSECGGSTQTERYLCSKSSGRNRYGIR